MYGTRCTANHARKHTTHTTITVLLREACSQCARSSVALDAKCLGRPVNEFSKREQNTHTHNTNDVCGDIVRSVSIVDRYHMAWMMAMCMCVCVFMVHLVR